MNLIQKIFILFGIVFLTAKASARFELPADNFDEATEWMVSPSQTSNATVSFFRMTVEDGEPGQEIFESGWWKFVPSHDGLLAFDLKEGSSAELRLDIFQGETLSALEASSPTLLPGMSGSISVREDENYYLRLSSTGTNLAVSQTYLLGLSFEVTPVNLRPFEGGPSFGAGGLPPGDYEITVAGQPARLVVGESYSPDKPTYLGYYLHGDEGGYLGRARPGSRLRQLIDDEGMIYISPRAPEVEAPEEIKDQLPGGYFPWSGGGGEAGQVNAAQIRAVIDYVFENYNVHRERVLGAGGSGGAVFHDSTFHPQNSGSYPVLFLLACGAADNSKSPGRMASVRAAAANPVAVAHSELFYVIGTEDFLFDNAVANSATNEDLGFSVRRDYLPGVPHCNVPTDTKVTPYWREKIELFRRADGGLPPRAKVSFDQESTILSWHGARIFNYRIEEAAITNGQWSWSTIHQSPGEDGLMSTAIARSSDKKRFFRLVRTSAR